MAHTILVVISFYLSWIGSPKFILLKVIKVNNKKPTSEKSKNTSDVPSLDGILVPLFHATRRWLAPLCSSGVADSRCITDQLVSLVALVRHLVDIGQFVV